MDKTIKELRMKTGLSQREFAERFHIPLSTLRKWEHGVAKPAPYVVDLIAQQIPYEDENTIRLDCNDGRVYFISLDKGTVEDTKGNKINVKGSFDGVNERNLEAYVEILFESYYDAQDRFERDLEYDKKSDAIWVRME